MDNSYLKSLLTAFRQDIYALYTDDGQTFQWNAYGSLYPKENEVYGAAAFQFKKFETTQNFDPRPYSIPHELLCQLEIRVTGSQGENDFGIIYDHHEFILNHLNKEVRVNGISGTYSSNIINQAFIGLEITKAMAGIDLNQNDLTKQRSIINFEWRYIR